MPDAYRAMRSAVAGATTIASAHWPSRVCGIGSPSSPNSEVLAGWAASALNVSGVTNWVAASVSTGATSHPASVRRRQTSTAL